MGKETTTHELTLRELTALRLFDGHLTQGPNVTREPIQNIGFSHILQISARTFGIWFEQRPARGVGSAKKSQGFEKAIVNQLAQGTFLEPRSVKPTDSSSAMINRYWSTADLGLGSSRRLLATRHRGEERFDIAKIGIAVGVHIQ